MHTFPSVNRVTKFERVIVRVFVGRLGFTFSLTLCFKSYLDLNLDLLTVYTFLQDIDLIDIAEKLIGKELWNKLFYFRFRSRSI